MARRLYCYVYRTEENSITDDEWERIKKLQHWYSSEFIWTAGKPSLKMFVVFPNYEHPLADENKLIEYIQKRWGELKSESLSENAIVRRLHKEKVILLREGGYYDDCLLSGSVRVADNEWNAYLFTELVLKSSRIAANATFEIHDEGEFIRWRPVFFRAGKAFVGARSQQQAHRIQRILDEGRLFAGVDPVRYDHHPRYRSQISGYQKLEEVEKLSILRNWNWDGYRSTDQDTTESINILDLSVKIEDLSLLKLY
jgi:hypothetical protein